MNYELAKQLKDARFPYSEDWYMNDNGDGLFYKIGLSELIEACGDNFGSVGRYVDMTGKYIWEAIQQDEIIDEEHAKFERGDTPEEAVAKLWLELNKKKPTL